MYEKSLGRRRLENVIRDTYKCVCVCVCTPSLEETRKNLKENKNNKKSGILPEKNMYSGSKIHRLQDDKLGKVGTGRWSMGKKEGEKRNRQRIGKVK